MAVRFVKGIHCNSTENNREKRLSSDNNKKNEMEQLEYEMYYYSAWQRREKPNKLLSDCMRILVSVYVCPVFGSCTEGKVRNIPKENNNKKKNTTHFVNVTPHMHRHRHIIHECPNHETCNESTFR